MLVFKNFTDQQCGNDIYKQESRADMTQTLLAIAPPSSECVWSSKTQISGKNRTYSRSRSSKVIDLLPIENAYATSYWSLIITLVVSCTVFEILMHKVRTYHVFPTPHLFESDRTENSAIRLADTENPGLEPNMEWIGCTVCEIFVFKLYCNLETGVRGHSRSSKVAPFERAHTTLYQFSTVLVNMPLSITVSEI